MLEVGKSFTVKIKVEEKDTARVVGSGTLDVLATPRMIALMEEASYKCIAQDLESGTTSVGTLMNVSHMSATPVGMEVAAVAEIVKVDGRKIEFTVEAYDEKGMIGQGHHERFVVNEEKFISRTYSKLES
ncbi:MAG: thioesterase family protein [Clostridia bacterium]|nr:thioesterase family protein [Clostridia bacterium]